MGQHGPIPKRSELSHGHVTKETDRAVNRLDGKLGPEPPDWLDGFALEWYESLRTSGQAVFYTDSDWATAIFVARHLMAAIRRPSAMMLSSVMHAMADLCVTEGQRRRVRIELERSGTHADPDQRAGQESMKGWITLLQGGKSDGSAS